MTKDIQHMAAQAQRPYAFLPINLTGSGADRPKLAVVDVEFVQQHPDAYRKVWKTTARGTVFRQFMDRGVRRTTAAGTRARETEQLAHLVLGVPPFTPTWAFNLDPLDCRKANIRLAENLVKARAQAKEYEPGLVVSKLEGHQEALLDLAQRPEFYLLSLDRHRAAQLSSKMTLVLLNNALQGSMVGQSAEAIRGWLAEEFGYDVHVNQIRLILKGESLRQPGFDYKALASTRLTPRERALQRWKDRQP